MASAPGWGTVGTMTSREVPADVALEVAAFVRARAHDPLPERAGAEDVDRQRVERELVRNHRAALDEGRAMTADNLAYTLLTAAARHRAHRDYRAGWEAWTPFGDLSPGSDVDGPAAASPHDEGTEPPGT